MLDLPSWCVSSDAVHNGPTEVPNAGLALTAAVSHNQVLAGPQSSRFLHKSTAEA